MNGQTRVNFHCHSNFSDGELSPEELAAVLYHNGVRAAALTDHDTIDGLEAFRKASNRKGIGCITGVEISSFGPDGDELHLLGYGFDPGNASLNEALRQWRAANRPVPSGTIQESWLRPGGESARWISPSAAISATAAISLLHSAGGIAVLAHPITPGQDRSLEKLDSLLAELKRKGLDGIEAIYADYSQETREALISLAGKHQLLVSAGSDFHSLSRSGLCEPAVDMPTPLWRQFRDSILRTRSEAIPAIDKPSPSTERRNFSRWNSFMVRIVFPTFLAIALFVFALYQIIIPSFEEKLLDRKREMIRELTNLACGILSEYDREARSGRLSLAEAQKAASERVQALRYGQEAKDYFWLMDTHPRMISHPYLPDLNGQDLTNFQDQRGVRIFVEFVNVLKSREDGYVEYVWQWKDNPERLAPKQSYIKKFVPWDWIVGTGLYVEDVREEIKAVEARMIHISLWITILSALLLVFVALQSMKIERRRREAEDELHESHEKYRTLVEAATDGILMVLDGRCTYANKTMAEMLNYSEAEFVLLDLADFFPEESGIDTIENLLSDGRPIPPFCETLLRKKGGGTIEAAVTVTPISSGDRTGFILAARDLGIRHPRDRERRRRENERENRIAELQNSLLFLHTPVSQYAVGVVTCDMRDSISRAVELMTRYGSTAILITSADEIAGIVTDRDIRERVVAAGVSIAEPVFRVMSSPIVYIQQQRAVYEAIFIMREKNLRHLVARDDTGQIVGIIDIRELLHFHRYTLAVLIQEVRNAETIDTVISVRHDSPKLVKSLIEGGVRARNITRSIATLADAVTSKLIHLAIGQIGPPPVRFAFLALGSIGREEPTLASDQDNAIVFDDVEEAMLPAVQDYFLQIGSFVCNGLHEAGYPLCEGHIMAKNPKWCQPVRIWKRYFSEWIRTAEPQNILDIMIFFDFRALHGEKEYTATLRQHIDEELATEPAFLLHYAQYAQQYRIPIGFFGNIVVESAKDHPPTFNIKEGMMPVVNFARLYALRHGVNETNTLDRIHELMQIGILRKSLCDEAVQVYECLMQIRLKHQADAADKDLLPDNAINPKGLTHMEETLLKEAFAQISTIQKKISYDFLGGS